MGLFLNGHGEKLVEGKQEEVGKYWMMVESVKKRNGKEKRVEVQFEWISQFFTGCLRMERTLKIIVTIVK